MMSKKVEMVLGVIKNRRSFRVYQEKSIPEEELNLILKAGRMAPSGGNSKTARVIVFQRKDMIRELEDAAQREFAQMPLKEGMYKSLYAAIKKAREGKLHFTYGDRSGFAGNGLLLYQSGTLAFRQYEYTEVSWKVWFGKR